MNVDLFAESSGSLERERERLTVDEDFPVQFSFVLPLSQAVHQGCLSATTRTHETVKARCEKESEGV